MLWRIERITSTPVISNGVRKDGAVVVESRRGDAATDFWVALKTVFGVLVPKVERTVGARGAESSVLGMERNSVDSVHFGDVALRRVLLAMAFEGEIETGEKLVDHASKLWGSHSHRAKDEGDNDFMIALTRCLFLPHTGSRTCPR